MMLAFTNTKVSKAALIASLEAHAAADRIAKGAYWQDGKGCAVGCSLRDFEPESVSDHSRYPELFGIPESIAHLEDAIFEALPNGQSKAWPLRFTRAIREGADLSRVTPKFLRRVISRRRAALADLQITDALRSQVDAAMGLCLDFLEDWAATGVCDTKKAGAAMSAADAAGSAAGGAAWSAAWNAVWNAARSAAWNAARSAADAARSAAWSAAVGAAWNAAGSAVWSAAWNAAWNAARSAEWTWMADALIEEIQRAGREGE